MLSAWWHPRGLVLPAGFRSHRQHSMCGSTRSTHARMSQGLCQPGNWVCCIGGQRAGSGGCSKHHAGPFFLPSASSSLPFKFCSYPEEPQAWSCQAWSTAQETLESLAQELRALCVLHNLNLRGESLKMLNISKMCPPLSSYVALSLKTLPLAAPSCGVCAMDSSSSILETPMCHHHPLQGNVQQSLYKPQKPWIHRC